VVQSGSGTVSGLILSLAGRHHRLRRIDLYKTRAGWRETVKSGSVRGWWGSSLGLLDQFTVNNHSKWKPPEFDKVSIY
jgi:hypothetical protein